MHPTRRLIQTLPALAAAAAVFALPAATAQASAAPTTANVQGAKPRPQVCTSTETGESTVTLGRCTTTTILRCEKGEAPVISTQTVCKAKPKPPK